MMQRQQVAVVTGLVMMAGVFPTVGQAQIIPDDTLGAERSRVVEEFVPGIDIIDQGARRRENLFHSFEQFNVDAGRGAFFLTPDGVENIFSRVTGNSPSSILGLLGVLDATGNIGTANLFFMNPNGIIFGPNSSLAIEGSFLATTADAIQFEDRGSFSAFNPAPPSQLLRINPSAFLFNQAQPGPIISSAGAGIPELGLRVPEGENLIFLGGDINIEGGRLDALGGRIELGGLAEPGRVQLSVNDGVYTLGFPRNATLSDLTLSNDARVSVRGFGGGDIVVNTNIFTVTDGGRLVAGTEGSQDGGDITVFSEEFNAVGLGATPGIRSGIFNQSAPDTTGDTGDVSIETSRLRLRERAAISTETGGQGDAGDLTVIADDVLIDGFGTDTGLLLRSALFSEALENSTGNTGNIRIETDRLRLRDGGRLSTVATAGLGDPGDIDIETDRLRLRDGGEITTGTLADGNGGNITVDADSVLIDGTDVDQRVTLSTGFNSVTVADGNAGSISINAERFRMQGGGQIFTSSQGIGEIGSIYLGADTIRIEGFLFLDENPLPVGLSTLTTGNTANVGNIRIEADRLRLLNGGQISTSTQQEGNAGSISITADNILIEGSGIVSDTSVLSAVSSIALQDSVGSAGDINVNASRFRLINGGQISSDTLGVGDAGDIEVVADNILADGFGVALDAPSSSGFFSDTQASAEGSAGNIQVVGDRLRLMDGGFISTRSFGQGSAGDINIDVRDILLEGVGISGDDSILTLITSSATLRSENNAGDIQVTADHLRLRDGGQIVTSAGGDGDAGDIAIEADSILLSGSETVVDDQILAGLFSEALEGDSGSIIIDTERLRLRNRGQISALILGSGNGGDVGIEADSIVIDGPSSRDNSSPTTLVLTGADINSDGNAGNVTVDTDRLRLLNGGQILSSTAGGGDAGDIEVEANSIRLEGFRVLSGLAFPSRIVSETLPDLDSDAGTIRVETSRLRILNGAQISTSTTLRGNAGNIEVTAEDILIEGLIPLQDNFLVSGLFSASAPNSEGNAGTVRIDAEHLRLRGGGAVSTNTAGNGNAGDIVVMAEDILIEGFGAFQDSPLLSGLFSTAAVGDGNAGTIRVNASQLSLRNGGIISTSVGTTGDAGNIEITAEGILIDGFGLFQDDVLPSGLFSTAEIGSEGDAGTIRVNTGQARLRDGGVVSTSTTGLGDAGDIRIEADSLSLNSALSIAPIQSQILSTSEEGSTGDAGTIRIQSGRVTVTDSSIRTSAAETSGGGIDITAEQIQLFGDGDIQTEVSTGEGGAGNLRLTADLIIAFDDSDILAFAEDGTGGNILLRTPAFFGESFNQASLDADPTELEGNNQVDVNATGGVPGTVNLPDLSFIQNSLSDLPQTTLDTDSLLANSCVTRTADGSTFLVTGVGGLPERPGEVSTSPYPTGTIRVLTPDAAPTDSRSWEPGDPVAEPQGLYQLPNGRLILSQECS